MLSMEKFQESLAIIREKEFQHKKQKEFNQWQFDYQEHLDELYKIINKYYVVNYAEFINLVYNTSLKNRYISTSKA